MSSKAHHYRAGLLLGVVSSTIVYVLTSDIVFALSTASGSIFGSSLPDQLEISWHTGGGLKKGWFARGYEDGTRHSLIPHRTITHWFLMWTIVSALAVYHLINHPASFLDFFVTFLILSGWLHVYMDSTTKMGVPILHPWRRTCGSQRSKSKR